MRLTQMWSICTGPLKSCDPQAWGQVVLYCASSAPDPEARCGACFVSLVTPIWLLSWATLPGEPVVAWSSLGYCALVKSSRLCQHTGGLECQIAARGSLISTLITETRYLWCVTESRTSPLSGCMWSCRGEYSSEYNQPMHLGCSEINVFVCIISSWLLNFCMNVLIIVDEVFPI